jgi:hypothetical protein
MKKKPVDTDKKPKIFVINKPLPGEKEDGTES